MRNVEIIQSDSNGKYCLLVLKVRLYMSCVKIEQTAAPWTLQQQQKKIKAKK